ncbi:hypothetical protein KKG31_03840 [Patescibacteria group bacterium]|nr:hypothetical protein [Patescibacteria group bacterium]
MVGAFVVLSSNNQSFAANTNTNTKLGIRTGVLTFYKDTGTDMNTYFSHSPNTSTEIDLGNYDPSLSAINAASSGNHRFTVSDLYGKSFTVTVQSSVLSASGVTSIPAANVGYTGTVRTGAGKALTAQPTGAVDIGTAPVTFVARTNASGISKYAQEITLKVTIPAAQAPENYTGMLTFTY